MRAPGGNYPSGTEVRAQGALLLEFDFEDFAFLDNFRISATVCFGIRPNDVTVFEFLHAFIASTVIFYPRTGLQVDQQAVGVGV